MDTLDTLTEITSYLSHKDILKMSGVCKSLRSVLSTRISYVDVPGYPDIRVPCVDGCVIPNVWIEESVYGCDQNSVIFNHNYFQGLMWTRYRVYKGQVISIMTQDDGDIIYKQDGHITTYLDETIYYTRTNSSKLLVCVINASDIIELYSTKTGLMAAVKVGTVISNYIDMDLTPILDLLKTETIDNFKLREIAELVEAYL